MSFDYDQYADEKVRLTLEQHQQLPLELHRTGLDLERLIADEPQEEAGQIDPEPLEADWGRCPRCEQPLVFVTSSKHCPKCGYHEGCCG